MAGPRRRKYTAGELATLLQQAIDLENSPIRSARPVRATAVKVSADILADVIAMLQMTQTIMTIAKVDGCEVCHGTRGGVAGNENRIDGKVMCDACTIDVLDSRRAARV